MEEVNDVIQLGKILREKILARTLESDMHWKSFQGSMDEYISTLQKEEIYNMGTTLFHEIDEDKSVTLTREELKSFLVDIGISFSRRKWRKIFRELDRNCDDQISVEEMVNFLFPKERQENVIEISYTCCRY